MHLKQPLKIIIIIKNLLVGNSKLILITAHRRENIGKPMHNMFRAIRRIVEEYSNIRVIYPIHMNPAVRQIASEELGNCENIHIIEPLDVIDFHNFMKKSYLILTDSGGIQEEAPGIGETGISNAGHDGASRRHRCRNIKTCRNR